MRLKQFISNRLTAQGGRTLNITQAAQGHSKQPGVVGGRLCTIKGLQCPLVPTGGCD